MKKSFIFLNFLISLLTLSSCDKSLKYYDEEKPLESSLLLSMNKCELEVGESIKLNYLMFNSDKMPAFTSNDENIAKVDNQGNIIAINIGTTNINVDLDDKHYSCEVGVIPAKQYYIFLNSDEIVVKVNETYEVNPILMKSQDSVINDAAFTYTSLDQNIFTITNNVIKGILIGDANLLITSNYSGVDYYKIVSVKVI